MDGDGDTVLWLFVLTALRYSGLRVRMEVRDWALSHPRGLPTQPVLGLPLPALVARGLVTGSFLTDGGLHSSAWCQPRSLFPWPAVVSVTGHPQTAAWLPRLPPSWLCYLLLGFPITFCK